MPITEFQQILPDGLLTDKVILITGASQGIGEAAAYGFARAGAKVVLTARRGAVVEKHAAAIRAAGGEALAVEANVSDEESVKNMVDQTVATFGRLDGAFNNAGIDPNPPRPLVDWDLDEWQRIFAVKADGTFLSMKYEIPAMLAVGGGAIVNNGSVVGNRALGNFAAPCSSQSAILGLTKSAAAAYAGQGIRINMVETGLIMTPERLAAPGAQDPARVEMIGKYAPMGRAGTGEEVAAVAGWLMSDWVSYVAGAVIPVDGGHLAGTP